MSFDNFAKNFNPASSIRKGAESAKAFFNRGGSSNAAEAAKNAFGSTIGKVTGTKGGMSLQGDVNVGQREIYQAYVVCNDKKIMVKAHLPQDFSFDVHSEFNAPFADGIIKGNEVGQVLRASSYSTTNQAMTMQIWQGSNPIDLTLPFVFVAERDSRKEVIQPIEDLLKLSMPSTDGPNGVFRSPGPTISLKDGKTAAETAIDATKLTVGDKDVLSDFQLKGKIALYIGRFLCFDNVVITSVGQSYDTKFDHKGLPLKATVNVSFKTVFTLTDKDIAKVFRK